MPGILLVGPFERPPRPRSRDLTPIDFEPRIPLGSRILHAIGVLFGAVTLTSGVFLLLPLLDRITGPSSDTLLLSSVGSTVLPPPEPELVEEEFEEVEPDEPPDAPPELTEAPPLELWQLELSLGSSFAGEGGVLPGSEGLLSEVAGGGGARGAGEELFSMADLDQRPRAVFQPSPALTPEVRRNAPGKVYVMFVVGVDGEVARAKVQKSSNPVFDEPAVKAVRKWRFEPGKRKGKPVAFRMRVPITFPEGV